MDRLASHELYGDDGFAKLSIAVNPYQQGDTWYRDMRAPGFNGKLASNSDNSVQWLAKQIVADARFAEATVKFWWPAIMGSEVAEPPEDEGDADFEGLLLAANAQGAEVTRLANGFRRGFKGRSAYNLKDLLVEIVLSKWFRAATVEDADPVRSVALRDAGARAAAHARGAGPQDRRHHGIQVGSPAPHQRCASRRLHQIDRRLPAPVRRHRFGRDHGAGARHHHGHGGGGQAARDGGELSRRDARFLSCARCRTTAVRGNRSIRDTGLGVRRFLRD